MIPIRGRKPKTYNSIHIHRFVRKHDPHKGTETFWMENVMMVLTELENMIPIRGRKLYHEYHFHFSLFR